jgi:uncharacterized protein (DUF362 family)
MYDYMWELHGSPFQRQMIAEINSYYNLDFVVMDGIKAFVTDGPESGKVVEPNLLLASKDRVAIDAVGVAILKMFGAKGKVGEAGVFEQDQLKRAAELGIGVKSVDEIKLMPLNSESQAEVEKIEQVLKSISNYALMPFNMSGLSLAMPSMPFLAYSWASCEVFMVQTMIFKPFSCAF